jgi:SPP1 family predicted phage head-tail adaptor
MRSGALDRTIVIERASVTVDEAGTPVPTWSVLYTLRAQLVQQSTDELLRREGGSSSENNIVFRVRYVAGVKLDDRLTYEGATFDVKELKEIGRRRGLEIRCIARAS